MAMALYGTLWHGTDVLHVTMARCVADQRGHPAAFRSISPSLGFAQSGGMSQCRSNRSRNSNV